MNFKEKIIILCCTVLFIGVFLAQDFFVKSKSKIVFCDVGQGDGAFINLEGGTPFFAKATNGTQLVIDGGANNMMIGCVGKYMPYFDRRIEYIIISHPDADHFIGAIEILKRYDVDQVLINGDKSDSPEWREFEKLVSGRLTVVFAGDDIKIALRPGSGSSTELKFLSPEKNEQYKDSNERSLIFKLSYGDTDVLFTGDAPEGIEKSLIKNKTDLKADILKISHHGSKESSIPEFLKAVAPRFAVISVGADNTFGHPAYRVIKNLENADIKYLRTDEAGDIIINLD